MKTKKELLLELSEEYARREQEIIDAWLKDRPRKGRGEGDMKSKKILLAEMALRYKEIVDSTQHEKLID